MILPLSLLIFFQPIFSSIFFLFPFLLKNFFQNKIKLLFLQLIFLSFISDIIFIKPLGFFLFLTSFSFLLITLLEKFLDHQYFYQKLIFLLIFNLAFLVLFFYFSGIPFSFFPFIKIFILNLLIQTAFIMI